MRYRIEFLIETTKDDSVCTWFDAVGENIDQARLEALDCATDAQRLHGATGFQIRNRSNGEVEIVENFET